MFDATLRCLAVQFGPPGVGISCSSIHKAERFRSLKPGCGNIKRRAFGAVLTRTQLHLTSFTFYEGRFLPAGFKPPAL
ncbi:hypothetical protein GOODEAATRI_002447 [Goodea atripinnis]|uniref:Uncharacterized protein n=1 Tax=Goodea atripinnis TaxID=208336 RepID=A0ABV0MY40_9TELE